MILKPREDRNASIAALERLMAHPRANRHDIERLRQQIDAIIKGDMSEGKAAFELDTHFGHSRNWLVIHDLRIEIGGMPAQIDHVLLGRCLDVWVFESKRLANGIKVLDNGECLTFRNGKVPVAIDSPIEQNRRHVKMLQRLFDSGVVPLPRRLGITLRPKLRSLVLIAEGRITRPKAPVPDIDTLIRTDQMIRHVETTANNGSPLDLAKVVGKDTLEDIGRQLVAQHKPVEFDWERRFGLKEPRHVSEPPATYIPPPRSNIVPIRTAAAAPTLSSPAAEKSAARPRSPAGECEACQAAISSGVLRYCQNNHERFGGRILCMACQPKATTAQA